MICVINNEIKLFISLCTIHNNIYLIFIFLIYKFFFTIFFICNLMKTSGKNKFHVKEKIMV